MKTGSPTLGFQHPAANIAHIPPPQAPLQRTAIQRHQARRSGHVLPKLAPGQAGSPKGQPTPTSHVSSPTSISNRSPMIMQQDGFNSPTSAMISPAQQYNFSRQPFYSSQQMSPSSQRPGPPVRHQSSGSMLSNHSSGGRTSVSAGIGAPSAEASASQLYSEGFQKHFDQLGKSNEMLKATPLYIKLTFATQNKNTTQNKPAQCSTNPTQTTASILHPINCTAITRRNSINGTRKDRNTATIITCRKANLNKCGRRAILRTQSLLWAI